MQEERNGQGLAVGRGIGGTSRELGVAKNREKMEIYIPTPTHTHICKVIFIFNKR